MNTTILLVEDSPDDVFFMKRAFKMAGVIYPLQVATDGQMALDYLMGSGPFSNRNEFPLPGLLLLDLKLPLVPGLEVLEWMRRQPQFECLPVIVLTSSREERDMQRAYSLRANSFLVKSPDPGHLTAMMKAVAEFWLVYNEVPAVCGEPVS